MLHDIAIFLVAAVIAVPVTRRLGLGAVLGYLVAGILIGPWALRLITDVDSILRFSEFGVVLLLFVIGLELQPSRLWRLRGEVFGLGGAQVAVTAAALAGIGLALDVSPATAAVAGFGLAMSSTAFVLQMLAERNELTTRHGRAAFAILLFQDLSVIPFLALVPLLAGTGGGGFSLATAAMAVAMIALLMVVGRYALRPLLRLFAETGVPEIFTAAALLVVVGTSLLMEAVGLSMSLGAFLAGVLLGLFFIAVGMSVNLGLVRDQPLQTALLVAILVGVKIAVLYGVGRVAKLPAEPARALAAALCQGGEFAFVLFGVAAGAGLLEAAVQQQLVAAVTLSMMLTPLLYTLQARGHAEPVGPAYDTIDAPEVPVLIAGFGPFGQIVGRLLRVKKIPFTVLEKSWQQVDVVRRFGSKIYYGDAGRLDVLKAARADRARILVISISNVATSMHIAESVRRNFPHLRVFAVANDRNHALRLMDLGITDVIRRAYFSSLEMSRLLLVALGQSADAAARDIETFRRHDEAALLKQQAVYRDEQQLIQTAQEAARELEQLFETDRGEK